MTDDAVLRDELAVERTLAAYCHLCDDGDFARLVELFTPDGSVAFGREVVTGRDALMIWFANRQPPERRGKHLTMNIIVDIDGNRAEAVSDYVFLRLVDGAVIPAIAGRYRDRLGRDGNRWVIERRDIEIMEGAS
jgi:SnoaL-like domain